MEDVCPNGLQVEGAAHISFLATAVSASLETIQKACDSGVQALIVHHGLFKRGDSFVIKGVKKEKLRLLLEHRISLFGYHLPMDAHPEFGNNWNAAVDLGLQNIEPFAKVGVQGKIAQDSVASFPKKVEAYYGSEARSVLAGKKMIERVALISGGAHKFLQEAIENSIDCFITGTCDEPTWYEAREGGIHFMALGHSATERVGPKALASHLESHFPIKASFIDTNNPF